VETLGEEDMLLVVVVVVLWALFCDARQCRCMTLYLECSSSRACVRRSELCERGRHRRLVEPSWEVWKSDKVLCHGNLTCCQWQGTAKMMIAQRLLLCGLRKVLDATGDDGDFKCVRAVLV
jgi:hypothetical protein